MRRIAKISGIACTLIFISRSVSLVLLGRYIGFGHSFWSFQPVHLTLYLGAIALICWAWIMIDTRVSLKRAT